MFYEHKFIAGVRNIFYDGILEEVRMSLDYTKCTETKERFPMLRTPLYLSLDALLLFQCTLPYSPSPSSFHTSVVSENNVVTFFREKLFGLVGRDQKSIRGIQQQALSGGTRKPHPYHLWDFFRDLSAIIYLHAKRRS
jgi:hypothetical protein